MKTRMRIQNSYIKIMQNGIAQQVVLKGSATKSRALMCTKVSQREHGQEEMRRKKKGEYVL